MNMFQYKVYYEDTDAGGVVYYANYLKFFERARTDFLLSKGVSQAELAKAGVFFVVKTCSIEYISSAILEDTLTVSCKALEVTKASVTFEQSITCNQKAIVHGNIKVVCVIKNGNVFKPKAIPYNVLTILQSI
jgi:acyl-CoA thioester hydrolase